MTDSNVVGPRKFSAFSLIVSALFFLLMAIALEQLVAHPKQIGYSTHGTNTEYGAFGLTFFTKRDDVQRPALANELIRNLEGAGVVMFTQGAMPVSEWNATRYDYFPAERLDLMMETTASPRDVLAFYTKQLGAPSHTSGPGAYGHTYATWSFGLNGSLFVHTEAPGSANSRTKVQIDLFRDFSTLTVSNLRKSSSPPRVAYESQRSSQ